MFPACAEPFAPAVDGGTVVWVSTGPAFSQQAGSLVGSPEADWMSPILVTDGLESSPVKTSGTYAMFDSAVGSDNSMLDGLATPEAEWMSSVLMIRGPESSPVTRSGARAVSGSAVRCDNSMLDSIAIPEADWMSSILVADESDSSPASVSRECARPASASGSDVTPDTAAGDGTVYPAAESDAMAGSAGEPDLVHDPAAGLDVMADSAAMHDSAGGSHPAEQATDSAAPEDSDEEEWDPFVFLSGILLLPPIWLASLDVIVLHRATLLPVAPTLGVHGCRGRYSLILPEARAACKCLLGSLCVSTLSKLRCQTGPEGLRPVSLTNLLGTVL